MNMIMRVEMGVMAWVWYTHGGRSVARGDRRGDDDGHVAHAGLVAGGPAGDLAPGPFLTNQPPDLRKIVGGTEGVVGHKITAGLRPGFRKKIFLINFKFGCTRTPDNFSSHSGKMHL